MSDPNLPPPKVSVDYFINISFSNKNLRDKLTKIRMKIPTVLVKTFNKTRRISQGCYDVVINGSNTNNIKKKCINTRKLFPNRVNSVLKVFGAKKSGRIPSFNGDQHSSDTDSFHSLNNENHPIFSSFSLANRSPLCDYRGSDSEQSIQMKLPLGEEEKEWEVEKICPVCLMRFREEEKYEAPPLFSPPLNFRGKSSNFSCTNSDSDDFCRRERSSCSSSFSSETLPRSPIKINLSKKEEIMVAGTEEEDGVDNNDLELCKKRILMGERCSRLNFSDFPYYDENGNPLPYSSS
ncbi:hypothetical protein NE237_012031 [Protea cynaroides]|uniref:Uncharacterized protein n=1 Tax=Protea cynaroides TaxID=273540 RepID=A0A9Q0JYV4_9MAGN|nr:hypothetical protein NE237_012031 [Protea cynaroides]